VVVSSGDYCLLDIAVDEPPFSPVARKLKDAVRLRGLGASKHSFQSIGPHNEQRFFFLTIRAAGKWQRESHLPSGLYSELEENATWLEASSG
jgi:hypothetical protein